MSEQDVAWQERRLEEILNSGTDPATMAQEIIRIGFEEEVADKLVELRQLGAAAPVYYETLSHDEYPEYDSSETKSKR